MTEENIIKAISHGKDRARKLMSDSVKMSREEFQFEIISLQGMAKQIIMTAVMNGEIQQGKDAMESLSSLFTELSLQVLEARKEFTAGDMQVFDGETEK